MIALQGKFILGMSMPSTMISIFLTFNPRIALFMAKRLASFIFKEFISLTDALPIEILIAHTLASVTRGLCVFTASFLLLWILGIIDFPKNIFWMMLYLIQGGITLGIIGLLTGIWAQKFDQLSIISNFVIQPLAFLSGTFYSIERLPESLKILAYCNPFFYAIDGLRFSFIGLSDASPILGSSVLLCCNFELSIFAWYILKTGYRLRS